MTIGEQIEDAEALDSDIKGVKETLDELEKSSVAKWRAIWDRMEVEGIEAVKVNGTRYGRELTEYGQVQDALTFEAWAREHKPELFQPKPRKALINQFVNKLIEDERPLPPGLGTYPKPWVSRRTT